MENNDAEIVTQQNLQKFEDNKKVKDQVLLFNLRHLGTNLSNLSIVCISFIILLFVGQVVSVLLGVLAAAILFIFLLGISAATLGIIYLSESFREMWSWFGPLIDGNTAFIEFLQKLLISTPYVCGIGILAAIGSIISFSFAKKHKSIPRIVISSIVIGLCIIGIIMYIVGVVK